MRKPPPPPPPPPVKVGDTFGALTAVEHYYAPKGSKRSSSWTCQCSCGKTAEVRQDNLTGGFSKSCGCRRFKGAIPSGINLSNKGAKNAKV